MKVCAELTKGHEWVGSGNVCLEVCPFCTQSQVCMSSGMFSAVVFVSYGPSRRRMAFPWQADNKEHTILHAGCGVMCEIRSCTFAAFKVFCLPCQTYFPIGELRLSPISPWRTAC